MEESILTSVKKMCGIPEEYDVFDMDLIIHINSVFMGLWQMGVGPDQPFEIESKDDLWTDFIPAKDKRFGSVKTYIGTKVGLIFDPPQSSVLKDSKEKILDELTWRLTVAAEM